MSILASLELSRIPDEDEALRMEIRDFLAMAIKDLPSHVRARSWSGTSAELSGKLGELGWIGITMPKEFGGGGRSAFARYVLVEEYLASGAPVGLHWIADRQSGPLILKYGTETQKRFYLPRICRGQAFFCIGMSEPNAGSDLASVRTRAVSNDHGYLLNGQKIWTTNAHLCHFMIALVRTSGKGEDRHRGLSQVVVDLTLPGVTIRPITDLSGDRHFCEVFFDNVQLSHDALIGLEGQGWTQATAELEFERSGSERLFSSIVLFDEWLAWIRASGVRSEGTLRLAGRLLTELAPLRAMSVSLQGRLMSGGSAIVEAALVKELGTTFEQLVCVAIADDLHSREIDDVPAELLCTLRHMTEVAPSFSLRGGTREILRGVIARGLGLR